MLFPPLKSIYKDAENSHWHFLICNAADPEEGLWKEGGRTDAAIFLIAAPQITAFKVQETLLNGGRHGMGICRGNSWKPSGHTFCLVSLRRGEEWMSKLAPPACPILEAYVSLDPNQCTVVA